MVRREQVASSKDRRAIDLKFICADNVRREVHQGQDVKVRHKPAEWQKQLGNIAQALQNTQTSKEVEAVDEEKEVALTNDELIEQAMVLFVEFQQKLMAREIELLSEGLSHGEQLTKLRNKLEVAFGEWRDVLRDSA